MNKLLTKIVGATLGLTMAIGVGVAVANSSKSVEPAKAMDNSYVIGTTALSSVADGDLVAWGTSSSNLAYTIESNWIKCNGTKTEWYVFEVKSATGGFYLRNYASQTNYVYSSGAKKVEWSTTNKTIFNIHSVDTKGDLVYDSNGNYTFNSTGIRSYANNNYTAAYLYSVTAGSTDPSIEIDDTDTEITVSVKENANLEKTLTLSNVTMAELSYDYDEDKISVVADNNNKKITISGVEHTTTATDLLIKKGSTTLYTVHVNVLYDNTVTITPATSTLKQGATLQLSATSSKGGDTFTWSSSDESVATVSASGLVTGVAEGSATITATSNSYSGTSGTRELTITFGADYSVASFYDSNELSNSNGTSASGDYVKGVFSGNSTVISSVTTYKTNYNKFGGLSMGTSNYEGYVTITMNSSYKLKSISVWAASVDNNVTEPTVLYGTGDTASTSATKLSNNAKIFGKSEAFDQNAVPFTYTFASDAAIVKLHATTKNLKWTIYKVVLCWTTVEATALSFDVGASFSLMNTITKTLKTNATPLYYNVALGALTWNSSNTDVATVTSGGVVEAKANSGSSTITATVSGLTATTVVHAISKVASSVTIDASIASAGATSDINGVTWAFSGASRYGNDYKSGNTLIAYTRGCILLDTGYIQNSTAAFFKIKKVIVALCLAANQTSYYGADLTVVGSNTAAGGSEVSSENSTSGALKTYTLAEGCDFVKISSTAKVDFNSVTIEYAAPEETIVSVAEFILGLQPDRGEEVIESCTNNNGTYLAAKGRMAMLDATARGDFQTSEDLTVAAARTRYGYWAANNHDAAPYDGELTPQNSKVLTFGISGTNNVTVITIIVITSLIGVASVGAYFLLRKRKEH